MAARLAPNLPGELISVVRGHCGDDTPLDKATLTEQRYHRKHLWLGLRHGIHASQRERINPEVYAPLETS